MMTLSLFNKTLFSGYATIIVSIMGFGGIQSIGIGILGEYIGRIYSESKRRSVSIVQNTFHKPSKKLNSHPNSKL